jgi:hypothetical protein
MNYYGISVSFRDESNLFYNPETKLLVSLPEGTYMPSSYFFARDDVKLYQDIVEKLTAEFCGAHRVKKFRLHEIRPGDKHYAEIHEEVG